MPKNRQFSFFQIFPNIYSSIIGGGYGIYSGTSMAAPHVSGIAGLLRSFDNDMPEEINRIVTDSISDIFFTTSKYANKNLIKEFKNIKEIKPEFKYSDDTRFDFLCDKILLEVKNVTLLRNKDFAEFPDAITTRGSKHLVKLAESIKKGFKPFVLFLTQIEGINKFKIARDIDAEYYKNYLKVKKDGVKFLAYRCKLNDKEIRIEKKINIIDE